MAKKTQNKHENRMDDRLWASRCVAMTLLNECYYREHKAGDAADNPRNYAEVLQSAPSQLYPVLADKSAFIEFRPTFVSYCNAILILIKEAFSHKKSKRFVIIGW